MSQPNQPYQPFEQPPWPPAPQQHIPPAPQRRRWIIPTIIAVAIIVGIVGAILIVRGTGAAPAGAPLVGAGTSAASAKAKKIGYGTPARTVAAAVGCSNIHPTPPASPDDVQMPGPDDSVLCVFSGEAVQVSTWKTASGQSTSLASAKLLVTGFGIETYFAQGAGWIAGLDGDAIKPEADRKVAEAIAAKLGGKVVHWTPSS